MKKIATKKWIRVLLCCIVSVFSFLLFANCGGGSSSSNQGDSTSPSIAYTQETLTLTVGDEILPEITYSGDETPIYESSNPTTVSVDEQGKVVALQSGTAVISATCGTVSDTLTVESTFGEFVPILQLNNRIQENLTVMANEQLDLSASVLFRNKTYTDATITYQVEGGNDAAMQGNTFSAKVEGDYVVKITGVWRNYDGVQSLRKDINIKVMSNIEVYVNDNSKTIFDLYTKESFGGTTFTNSVPFEVFAKYNGEDVEPEITWISGADCVNYEQNRITGVKAGRAVCEISYGGVKQEITIHVNAVFKVYEGEPIPFSTLKGTLPLMELFGEETTLISAVDEEGNALGVENNCISGIEAGKDGAIERTITICSDTVGYTVDILVYSMYIQTQEDLQLAFQGEGSIDNSKFMMPEFDGYYVLANDITANSTVHEVLTNDLKVERSKIQKDWAYLFKGGLTGVFDGNGHTIDGLYIQNYGVFGMVNGGTVKNVNFNNVHLVGTYGYSRATLGYSISGATIENVRISTEKIEAIGGDKNDAGGSRALVANIISGKTNMKNCVFVCPEIERATSTYKYSYGSLFTYDLNVKKDGNTGSSTGFTYTMENIYVISPYYLGAWDSNLKDFGFVFDSEKIEYTADALPTGFTTTTNTYQITGVKRYDDERKMMDADNDYSAFVNSGYWQLDDNGLPIWKN